MKILLLAGNTLRSRAYAQNLKKIKNISVTGLFYGFEFTQCDPPQLNDETKLFFKESAIDIPDLSEPLQNIFDLQGWNYVYMTTKDVNQDEVILELNNFDIDLIIFSGYGGQILSKNHFISKIPYLHMHPGFLPEERGSTTIYYSILNKKDCSVTAFYMSQEIDKGEIIFQKQYSIPNQYVNIDQWYDNIIRADCMLSAINNVINNCAKIKVEISIRSSEEFYIIHPLLKHLAILSLPI